MEHPARADGRVGHADIQPAPVLPRRRDHGLAAPRVGRVGVFGHRLAARRRDLVRDLVGRPAPVRVHHAVAVVDHDLRALPGQRQAERPPETPPAAGDDRHPPGQRPGAVVGSRPGRHPLRPGVQVSRPNPPRGDELVRAVRSVSSTKASATTAPWFVTFLAVATLALASRGPARPVRKALAGGRHQVADSAAHSILPLASGALCPPARLRGALPSRSPPGAFAAPPSFVAPQPGRNPAGRGIPRRAMRSS